MSSTAQPYVEFRAGSDLTAAKDELRRAILAARERRSPRERERAATDLAQVVGDLPAVRGAGVVAAYASRAAEPATTPILERLLLRGTRVLVPVLGAGLAREWAWLTATDQLEVRAPGRPPEPPGPSLPAGTLAEAEVVLVPALAVDTVGTRLGHGGGWYDRVLAHARPGTPLVALVYPEEVYDAADHPLPREPHDRLVDSVATTAGWRRLG
jgi:5-formyltetrahydrofolate cyclo-ligase